MRRGRSLALGLLGGEDRPVDRELASILVVAVFPVH